MHSISYILSALLYIASLVVADEAVLQDSEQAIMSIVTRVRHEQTFQALIFPHINCEESAGVDRERYRYVNSILSAVVPDSELQEAQDDPSALASTPLTERPWYEGLPAAVKEYLSHMAKVEARMAEMDLAAEKEAAMRFRGRGWWWS